MTKWTGGFLLLAAILAGASYADPDLVTSPGVPPEGIRDVTLVEEWRAGGEDDDEVFFGNVLQVLASPDGGIYVLDSQLLQVFAFTSEGELRTTLGGRGEGPGEINNVNSILILPDGNLGIGQVLPGVIACLEPDGTPVRKIRIRDEEAPDSAFVLFMDGWALGDDLLTIAMRWNMAETTTMTQEMYLRSYDLEGAPLVDFLHKSTPFDLADFRFTEAGFDFVWTRCGVLPDGRVVFAPERQGWKIRVCMPDGTIDRIFERPYETRMRTGTQIEEARLSHAAVASHYGREVRGVEVENTQPDITALAVMEDGTLRVRTSRGDGVRPTGVLTTLDVVDIDGRFVRQDRLMAPGDPDRDAIHLLPDGRVVVVTGAVQAYRREQNTERGADALDTEMPLEVICYTQVPD